MYRPEKPAQLVNEPAHFLSYTYIPWFLKIPCAYLTQQCTCMQWGSTAKWMGYSVPPWQQLSQGSRKKQKKKGGWWRPVVANLTWYWLALQIKGGNAKLSYKLSTFEEFNLFILIRVVLEKMVYSIWFVNIFSVGKRLVGDKEKAEERKGINNLNVVRWKMVSLRSSYLWSDLASVDHQWRIIFMQKMSFSQAEVLHVI